MPFDADESPAERNLMCGICGFVDFEGAFSEHTLLEMNASIVRRGPDGAGYYYDGVAGLAMRRLAIIDLEGGQQPIFNETRSVCVVFNGEIYNYRRLRQDLLAKGHRFATNSDTEVIVHLYEECGAELPRHLDGMFAFAVWDLDRQSLLLARDRLGIKPLFFSRTATGVVFGSEIKCLMASGRVTRNMDWQALDQYLTYTNVPTPRTIYADVRQLSPGTTLTLTSDHKTSVQRYWSIPEVREEVRNESEWIVDAETALQQAVQTHLVSDVPVGAFLSGGVDSGLMVALMANVLDQPVETFTVAFKDAGSAFMDERHYARTLAKRYRLNYHEIDITPRLENIIQDIVTAFDQPFADDSVVPSYYVSQLAAQHVKVALTGLGGDELFGGYRRHLGLLWGERYARLPKWLGSGVVAAMIERLPESAHSNDSIDHMKRFARAVGKDSSERYQDYLATLPWPARRQLYTAETASKIAPHESASVMRQLFEVGTMSSTLERALRTDLQAYLVDDILTLTDRLSMWHSLELRVPYLDHHFVELAARIPARLKIRGNTQKYLLKRIAERWLPREMIYHKKQGFEAPMGRWLRGPLLGFFDATVNRQVVDSAGIFRYEEIRRLRGEHVGLKRKHSKILFALMMFHLWHAQVPR